MGHGSLAHLSPGLPRIHGAPESVSASAARLRREEPRLAVPDLQIGAVEEEDVVAAVPAHARNGIVDDPGASTVEALDDSGGEPPIPIAVEREKDVLEVARIDRDRVEVRAVDGAAHLREAVGDAEAVSPVLADEESLGYHP